MGTFFYTEEDKKRLKTIAFLKAQTSETILQGALNLPSEALHELRRLIEMFGKNVVYKPND